MARADCIIAGWLYGWQDGRVFPADHETFGGIRGTSPKPAPVIGRVQGWGVVIPRSMPPRSFHYDRIGAWEAWVLEHGLPGLPDTLGENDQVPIAYWAGPVFGAVVSRHWRFDEEENPDGARTVFDDSEFYVRTTRGWVPTGGGGGGGGPVEHPMRPAPVPERFATLSFTAQSGTIVGCEGLVGAAARTVELADRHGMTRRAIEAPLGLVIVCCDVNDDVEIHVLDESGAVLAEACRSGEEW